MDRNDLIVRKVELERAIYDTERDMDDYLAQQVQPPSDLTYSLQRYQAELQRINAQMS